MIRAACAVAAAFILLAAQAVFADPFAAPPVGGRVTRLFDPPATRFGPGHRGVDLEADPGELVRAAMSGTVTFAGEVAGTGWVTVDHGGGLDTTYGPIARARVRRGGRVRTGQVLGRLADDADHLDWGARHNEEYIDPLGLLGPWEVTLIHPDEDVPTAWLAAATTFSASTSQLAPPVRGTVTSGFGIRVHPITGESRVHEGVDVAAAYGTPVVAAGAGTVTYAGAMGGYGQVVTVDHGSQMQTRYAHLASINVTSGERVVAGEQIGAVGSTGLSTGPHLHFEVRVGGVAQDPARFLAVGPGG